MSTISFRQIWNRLSRSVPALGIAAHLGYRGDRLQNQRDEDDAYVEMMESMGSTPRFPHHSEQRERYVLVGELVSHILAISAGIAAYLIYKDLLVVWLATWALAFIADWFGGKSAGWLFDRNQPSVEQIVDAVAADAPDE